MPIYLMLTNLTDEGRKAVKEKPGRIKEVNKEVEKMGVKILSQYALLGVYDFVKRSSLLSFSRDGFMRLAKTVMTVSEIEGLNAHGNTIRVRLEKN